MGDQLIDMNLEFNRGEIRLDMDEFSMSLGACFLDGSTLDAGVREHWLADKVRFPVHDLIPEKARKFLATNDTTLYYRLKNIEVSNHQLTARAQLEWIEIKDAPAISLLEVTNSTVLDIDLREDDRVTIWLEDAIINELLGQVDWNFEWMNERIPVTSPVIPPDSREFLSTLCTQCYFQVNVGARGQPTLSATNSSLVLEKRDRVHLQVVNPDRNITSVFVAFILTIQAEVRPTFDGGTLRTLVQLLDTNIEMESGAFPKNWGLFMQDLMRGMIMDMLWPEIKNAIEELSYGEGVRISRTCGVDPNEMNLNIGEGKFSLTSRLVLQYLDPEKCIKDMKSSLPSTSKIFQNIEQK
uniref:BPI2 domain-containing protein n=1 Tax=Heterorhabditis bacteriophora TaxID=37862 RepID=A0A1I7XR28_HETBA